MITAKSPIDRTCNLQFKVHFLKALTEGHADSAELLAYMVNWWRVDGHGEIMRLVGLQYI